MLADVSTPDMGEILNGLGNIGQETMHELPMAVHLGSVSPTAAIAITIGAATSLVTLKKLTPHWHHTINEGEVGVWLSQGRPMLRKGITAADVEAAEAEDPFSTEAHYKVANEDWYFVPAFRTLQTVDVADQPLTVKFPVETADDPTQKLEVHANLTWHVSKEGDNPIRAITRVKHLKTDKKDQEANKDAERREPLKVHPLEGQVAQVCTTGLGRVLSGRRATYLRELTHLGETNLDEIRYQLERDAAREKTIEQCRLQLIHYGVVLDDVNFVPVVRSDAEVQAQALRTLNAIDGAVAAVASHGAPAEAAEAEVGAVGATEKGATVMSIASHQQSRNP